MKKAINELNIDLCLLQELSGKSTISEKKVLNENQLEYLADTTWKHSKYGKNAVYPKRHHGNAILSKYSILDSSNQSLTLHKLEQRGFLHCTIQIDQCEKQLHVINTHLNLRTKDRQKQVSVILKYIEETIPKESPLILAGDFNDWNYSVDKLIKAKSNLVDVYFKKHRSFAKTFPSVIPTLGLDRIYFRNLKPLFAEVLDSPTWQKLSDHLPVYSEFEI